MREVIKEGRDVNEAIDLACAQLGVERGQASFEIIELPKTSLFGLRKKPAKVRVYVEEVEAPKKKQPEKNISEKKVQSRPEHRIEPHKDTPKMEKPPMKAEAKPEIKQVQLEPKVEPTEKAKKPEMTLPVQETQKTQSEPQKQDAPIANEVATKFIPMEETEGKVRVACDYVKAVLLEMGVDAKMTVSETENGVAIRLAGEGLGVVIGRRGETLDSLQYLTGLVANRCEGDYLRVTIDTGNYREKRERTLQQLARKLSASALRSGRSSMLEPMNPYERRIIHSTVSTIEGVTSSSIGEEPNRRVVITPVNAKPRPPRKPGTPAGGPPRRGNGGNGRRGDFRERPPRKDQRPTRPDWNAGERPERAERTARNPKEDAGHLTSTAVDREYAKELEREPALAKPEQLVQEEARERVVREKPKDEAGNLPLYGKIEL